MNKRNLYLAIITSVLIVSFGALLAVVGTENIALFIALLVLAVDACCFPCAYMQQVDCRLKGKFNMFDGIPAHAGLMIIFFMSPYFAVLYILDKH